MDYENFNLRMFAALSETNLTEEQVEMILNTMDIVQNQSEEKYYEGIPVEVMDYISSLRMEKKKQSTIDEYELELKLFFKNVGVRVEDVTSAMVRSYLVEYQKQRNIKDSSLDQKRIVLGCFFSWAYGEGVIDTNPLSRVRKIKYEKVKQLPIPEYDAELLKDACKNYTEKALIELFYSTGCRISEISEIKIQDINFKKKSIRVYGKGGEHRTVFFSDRCKLYVMKYMELERPETTDDGLFVSERKPHRQINDCGIRKRFNAIQNRLSLDTYYKPHSMRRSFATNMHDRGMPIEDVQTLLGHKSPTVTMRNYINITDDNLMNSYSRFVS